MGKTSGHRKRVRHFDEPGNVHELTFSRSRRLPLVTNNEWRAELAASLDHPARPLQQYLFRPLALLDEPAVAPWRSVYSSTFDETIEYLGRDFSIR